MGVDWKNLPGEPIEVKPVSKKKSNQYLIKLVKDRIKQMQDWYKEKKDS